MVEWKHQVEDWMKNEIVKEGELQEEDLAASSVSNHPVSGRSTMVSASAAGP